MARHALALVATVACAPPSAGPRLTEIAPAAASAHASTAAVVTGDALYAEAHVGLDHASEAALDTSWSVQIDGAAIATSWVDPQRIDVTIPIGLAIGTHEVVAISPSGVQVPLPDGLAITDDGMVGSGSGGSGSGSAGSAGSGTAGDPFGDGTTFAFAVGYHGGVYLGPDGAGASVVELAADGSVAARLAFSLPEDTTGSKSANTSAPPFPSLGATGCTQNTHACGPDDENGRGELVSATVDGTEWLVAAGASTAGAPSYLYMTSDSASPLTFRYVDLNTDVSGGSRAWSALGGANDVLYAGVLGSDGNRPVLVAIDMAPPSPGLDPGPQDVVNLRADKMPGMQVGPTSSIDTITEFGGVIYIANAGAWWRATVATPGSYQASQSDWAPVTPGGNSYSSATSLATTKLADLTPADRAVPQMAGFGGRLFAGRNTTSGPQLWSCDPTHTADKAQCDPGDWTVVAAAKATPAITSLGADGATAITMVTATADALYVGFDSPAGAVVYRTTVVTASAATDFTVARAAGLGVGATAILDGKALPLAGVTSVWITAGTGTSPVAVVNLP